MENRKRKNVLGVDLDKTLARWEGFKSNKYHIGQIIPEMKQRVMEQLENGRDVIIFTSRATDPNQIPYIQILQQ